MIVSTVAVRKKEISFSYDSLSAIRDSTIYRHSKRSLTFKNGLIYSISILLGLGAVHDLNSVSNCLVEFKPLIHSQQLSNRFKQSLVVHSKKAYIRELLLSLYDRKQGYIFTLTVSY